MKVADMQHACQMAVDDINWSLVAMWFKNRSLMQCRRHWLHLKSRFLRGWGEADPRKRARPLARNDLRRVIALIRQQNVQNEKDIDWLLISIQLGSVGNKMNKVSIFTGICIFMEVVQA